MWIKVSIQIHLQMYFFFYDFIKLNYLFSAYFSSVVKIIYNLLYYQVIVQISCGLTQAERNSFLRRECVERGSMSSETILCKIIEYFSNSPLYHTDTVLYDPSTSSCTPYARDKMHSIEQQVDVN